MASPEQSQNMQIKKFFFRNRLASQGCGPALSRKNKNSVLNWTIKLCFTPLILKIFDILQKHEKGYQYICAADDTNNTIYNYFQLNWHRVHNTSCHGIVNFKF